MTSEQTLRSPLDWVAECTAERKIHEERTGLLFGTQTSIWAISMGRKEEDMLNMALNFIIGTREPLFMNQLRDV